MIHTRSLFPLALALILTLVATPALAHDGVEHATEVEAEAHLAASISPSGAVDFVKARAKEIGQAAQNARVELKAETRADLKAASSSDEKKGVIRTFVGERVDIAKNRAASTTALKRGVRAAIHWHGGLIRERFVVAFRQFDRIVARIESRIEKLEAQGTATASVETELGEAKTAIATAKVDAQAIADFVANIEDDADRTAVKAELEAKIRTAHASLKAAHQALKETVRALVALKPKVDASATSSASVSTD